MRPEDRGRIQAEVVNRLIATHLQQARAAPEGYLETLINDTLYHERQRLEKEPPARAKRQLAFYEKVRRRMKGASDNDQRQILEQLARRFVAEIVGNFDRRVYRFATKAIPAGLWGLLNAVSPQRLLALQEMRQGLANQLRIEGDVAHLNALVKKGTLVVVPTHSSNLDSIVLGYANYLMGLPPLTYGAGLNLFTNPLISFFMRNLGAYRVDRKKTATIYKELLKEYATCSLEMGYHNLFFPGGTRARSGSIEQNLKKGLLGASLQAYIHNLRQGRPLPKIYVVPWTVSYMLVLEGETLIDDHLKETGKSRYIIEDDEFSKPRLIFNFMSKLLTLDTRIVITVSEPLDVFGNKVDREGHSLDSRGRRIDTARYVTRDGEPVFDDQRDSQFTKELANEVCRSYRRDNTILPTHLVAFCLFQMLRQHNPELDLYRLLRTGGRTASFSLQQLHRQVERLTRAIKDKPEGPRLDPLLQRSEIEEIVADGLKAFGLYHTRPAASLRGDRVYHGDRNLLLFYGNRLAGYELEDQLTREGRHEK